MGTIIHAEGEMKSAEMIGDAIKANPGFIELRRITVAKEISQLLARSSNRMVLSTESLLLNLMSAGSAADRAEQQMREGAGEGPPVSSIASAGSSPAGKNEKLGCW